MSDSLTGEIQMFLPDVLLPAQQGRRARRVVLNPSHRLMVAVFEDAIEIFQKHHGNRTPKVRALFDETCEWFWSDDREWPYSFLNVCDVLGFEPEYVRLGLLKWLSEQPKSAHSQRLPGAAPVQKAA